MFILVMNMLLMSGEWGKCQEQTSLGFREIWNQVGNRLRLKQAMVWLDQIMQESVRALS